jgi:hypothetical protein
MKIKSNSQSNQVTIVAVILVVILSVMAVAPRITSAAELDNSNNSPISRCGDINLSASATGITVHGIEADVFCIVARGVIPSKAIQQSITARLRVLGANEDRIKMLEASLATAKPALRKGITNNINAAKNQRFAQSRALVSLLQTYTPKHFDAQTHTFLKSRVEWVMNN